MLLGNAQCIYLQITNTNEIKVSKPTVILLFIVYFENAIINQTAHCLSSSQLSVRDDETTK